MKKNIRLIIIISIIVAVLGIASAVLLSMPESEDSGIKTTATDILLYDKTSLDAEEITVENLSGEFTFLGFSYAKEASQAAEESAAVESQKTTDESRNLRTVDGITPSDIKMHYTMQGYDDNELISSLTDVLAYQCSYLTALKIVDRSGSKYADYGLDKPRATITVTFSNNSQETIYLGSDAPGDAGIYMRRDGNANVYLTALDSVDSFFVAKLQYFDTMLTSGLETEETIKLFTISGRGFEKPISITSDVGNTTLSTYVMTSPRREICSTEKVENVANDLFGFNGLAVISAKPTKEEIAKYGLEDPYAEVSGEGINGTAYTLLISEADSDGCCYIMKKDGTLICKLPVDDISGWYYAEDYMFFSNNILYPVFTELTGVDITTGGKTYNYRLKSETKEDELFEIVTVTEVTLKGYSGEINGMDTYITNLGNIRRGEYTDTVTGDFKEIYKAVLTYSQDDPTDTIQIYSNGQKYLMAYNGIVECYVDADYIQKLLDQTKPLSEGKSLEYIEKTTDEESVQENSQ